jgi:hypothetical protein
MRRRGLVLAFTLIAGAALADGYPFNEQPMFGGQPKTPEMLAADQQFFAATAKFGYTPAQGSDKSVQLGWQYFFQKHDVPTAMKRFNQAWLLDPDNGDAFHGFAVLVMSRDHDATQADALSSRASRRRGNRRVFIWITVASCSRSSGRARRWCSCAKRWLIQTWGRMRRRC